MRRNLLLLAACQALLLTSGVIMVSSAPLVGSALAPRQSLSTVPLALFDVALMATAVPASMVMKRIGRRWGFTLGGALGVLGGAIAAGGVMQQSFALFCGGTAVLGAFMAFGGYYRFAASEVAPPEYCSRAIGYVTGGGVLAAFSGTWLSTLTRAYPGVPEFTASYLVVAGTAVVIIALALVLRVPTPTREECARCGRPLSSIVRQPAFIVAVVAASLGYFVMTIVMNATPLAMRAQSIAFGATALVIQWHVFAMFAPSFFTGPLIARAGITRVLGVGAALALACVLVNLAGDTEPYFFAALLALGVAWNFLYVGGTTLLTRTYEPEERAKTQGANDFIVYATTALAALSAGALESTWGWRAVNLAALPAILTIAGAVVWLSRTERNTSVAS